MFRTIVASLTLLVLAAAPAAAHSEGAHGAKHGGKVVESGHHHLEVVVKDGSLEVFVEGEDGRPEDIKEAKATATVLSGGKKEDVTLAPGDASLKGTGSFTAVKGTTVVITLTMPGHKPEQARVKLD